MEKAIDQIGRESPFLQQVVSRCGFRFLSKLMERLSQNVSSQGGESQAIGDRSNTVG